MNRLRAVFPILVVLAGIALMGASAAPARAAYPFPSYSWFSGGDEAGNTITFHVGHGRFGRVIDQATFDPVDFDSEFSRRSDFGEAEIAGGNFHTCAMQRVTDVFSRRYCIFGEFDKADHARGSVLVTLVAGGETWRNPLGFFRWEAERVESADAGNKRMPEEGLEPPTRGL